MKNALITALAFVFLCTAFQLSFAQSSKNQLYYVIESEIIPAKLDAYMGAVEKLSQGLKEGGVDDISWYTAYMGDNRVVYIAPIENMAQLDENMWTGSVEKLGLENFMKLVNPLSEYTATSRDGIVMHRRDLSYRHPSLTEENFYRQQQIYICKPGSEAQAIALSKEYVALCKKHDIVSHYNLYTGVLGAEDYTISATFFAKDAATLEAQRSAIQKKMGEELLVWWEKLMAITVRVESREGRYYPSLSFIPAK